MSVSTIEPNNFHKSFINNSFNFDIYENDITTIHNNNNRSRLLMAASSLQNNRKMNNMVIIKQSSINSNHFNICMDCNSSDLIPIEGYITCRQCGLCQGPVIDSQDEKRYHEEQPGGSCNTNHRANSSTVGSSVVSEVVPNTILGSSIGYSNKRGDAKYARIIRRETKYKQYTSRDSSTLKKLSHLSNICKSAGINKRTIEEIQWTFYKLSNIESNKRRKLQSLMATATIIGCRACGVEKDMNEIATKFDLDIKVLRRMVKQYEMVWNEIQEEEVRLKNEETKKSRQDYQNELEKNHIIHIKSDNEPGNIEDDTIQDSINKKDNLHLLKYLRKLPIPECYHSIIFNINDWINTNNTLAQHIPISRYASVIYLATQLFNLDINKSQIVVACGISEITIKKCYSKLLEIENSMRQILNVN